MISSFPETFRWHLVNDPDFAAQVLFTSGIRIAPEPCEGFSAYILSLCLENRGFTRFPFLQIGDGVGAFIHRGIFEDKLFRVTLKKLESLLKSLSYHGPVGLRLTITHTGKVFAHGFVVDLPRVRNYVTEGLAFEPESSYSQDDRFKTLLKKRLIWPTSESSPAKRQEETSPALLTQRPAS